MHDALDPLALYPCTGTYRNFSTRPNVHGRRLVASLALVINNVQGDAARRPSPSPFQENFSDRGRISRNQLHAMVCSAPINNRWKIPLFSPRRKLSILGRLSAFLASNAFSLPPLFQRIDEQYWNWRERVILRWIVRFKKKKGARWIDQKGIELDYEIDQIVGRGRNLVGRRMVGLNEAVRARVNCNKTIVGYLN